MTATVNIHEAKKHLSRLVEQAAKGREFIIAKAGKPMVRVVALEPPGATRNLGLMAGKGTVRVDVKSAFVAEIDSMFKREPRA
jgi:prevent-host-death family protein